MPELGPTDVQLIVEAIGGVTFMLFALCIITCLK